MTLTMTLVKHMAMWTHCHTPVTFLSVEGCCLRFFPGEFHPL